MTSLTIADSQRAAYREQGFLALAGVVDSAEITRVRDIFERLFRSQAGRQTGDFLDLAGADDDVSAATLPQILMPLKYAPELERCSLRDAARQIARGLLGDGIQDEGEHAILKPAHGGPETPLHQDEAFWSDATDYDSLSVWFPLQDVSDENGCMRFVPRSHQLGVFPHHSVDGDVRKNGLEIDHATGFDTAPVQLAAGGATVHHCRTIHGAGPNSTASPRFAYIFGFGLPARRSDTLRDFYWLREKQLRREERARLEGFELTKMRPEL